MISGPIILLLFLGWALKGLLSSDERDIEKGKEAASGLGCAIAAGVGGSVIFVLLILGSL